MSLLGRRLPPARPPPPLARGCPRRRRNPRVLSWVQCRWWRTTPPPGFYSHVFLVPKKSGEWRLIIDLSHLNHFLRVPRFKMETTRSVATAIQPKDWAVSLDLRDAYFHIPMHPDYQHFLRFSHEGKVYQFQALPFRLARPALIFTTVVKAFVTPFHAKAKPKAPFLSRQLVAPLPVPHDPQKAAHTAPAEGPPGRMGGERRQVRAGSVSGFCLRRSQISHSGGTHVTSPGPDRQDPDRIVKIRYDSGAAARVFQPGTFFSSWGCSSLRQIKCLQVACTCTPFSSCSSHSGTPTRPHWTGWSGSRGTSWGRSGISGARSPASPRNFHVH
jgi:hypothetical protein